MPLSCPENQDPNTPLWKQARGIAATYGSIVGDTNKTTGAVTNTSIQKSTKDDQDQSTGNATMIHLVDRYGDDAATVMAIAENDSGLADPLVPGLPYLRAEAVYAARHEMARSVDDVLSRRTRARLLARDESAAVAELVATLLASELGWDDRERVAQAARYRELVGRERSVPQLPETALEAALGS